MVSLSGMVIIVWGMWTLRVTVEHGVRPTPTLLLTVGGSLTRHFVAEGPGVLTLGSTWRLVGLRTT